MKKMQVIFILCLLGIFIVYTYPFGLVESPRVKIYGGIGVARYEKNVNRIDFDATIILSSLDGNVDIIPYTPLSYKVIKTSVGEIMSQDIIRMQPSAITEQVMRLGEAAICIKPMLPFFIQVNKKIEIPPSNVIELKIKYSRNGIESNTIDIPAIINNVE